MTLERKITLKNNIYYIEIELEYLKQKNNIITLSLKNDKNNYFDCGNVSLLINKIEKNYNENIKYDNQIAFMSDVIYIYKNIPFINKIKNISVSKNDNLPYDILSINKEEIEKYIKDNKIKMDYNDNFKLFDETTWEI